MVRKLRWTPLALQDLSGIRDYIHRNNPTAAKKEAKRIRNSVERLARFPLSGRSLKVISLVREVVSGNYRIFYLPVGREIRILRIYHGSRDVKDLLDAYHLQEAIGEAAGFHSWESVKKETKSSRK